MIALTRRYIYISIRKIRERSCLSARTYELLFLSSAVTLLSFPLIPRRNLWVFLWAEEDGRGGEDRDYSRSIDAWASRRVGRVAVSIGTPCDALFVHFCLIGG